MPEEQQGQKVSRRHFFRRTAHAAGDVAKIVSLGSAAAGSAIGGIAGAADQIDRAYRANRVPDVPIDTKTDAVLGHGAAAAGIGAVATAASLYLGHTAIKAEDEMWAKRAARGAAPAAGHPTEDAPVALAPEPSVSR